MLEDALVEIDLLLVLFDDLKVFSDRLHEELNADLLLDDFLFHALILWIKILCIINSKALI